MDEPPVPPKQSYEEAHPTLLQIVEKRRHSWEYLSVEPWEEIRSLLIIHLWTQYHTYDPTRGPLDRWANTLVSNRLQNLKRDQGGRRLAKPCVGGGKANGKRCEFNKGGDSCTYTPSGIQCSECPVYARWEKERKAQHYAKSQVSLENHAQEVYSRPDDSVDIEGVRDWLHEAMLRELSRWEGRIYRLSIMMEMTPAEVVDVLARVVAKRKRPPAAHEQYTYSAILTYNRMFKGMMRALLLRQGHIGPEHMDPHRNRHRQLSHS